MHTPPHRRPRRLRVGAGAALAAALTTAALGITAPDAASPVHAQALSSQERAEALLAQMTLAEKVDMLHGELNNFYGFYNAPIERLGIPALTMADGPGGVRIGNPNVNDRKSTALPAPIALAATWDVDNAYEYGNVIGDEAHKSGHNVSLGTAVDIARVGRAGRAFETYGEDPLLTGDLAAAQITGIQGHHVIADLKHYNVYNQENDRLTGGNSVISERALQEIYVRPFDIGIRDGQPGSAMCSFNKVNYVYACEHSELMNEILREQIGFAGWVMSDYAATHSVTPAFDAGLDQEMPGFQGLFAQLVQAVQNGDVTEAEIDVRVMRILVPMFELGLFDHPPVVQEFDEAAHALTSQRIAEEGMVLLKNDGVLPLDPSAVESVAVIGADADHATSGGGSAAVAFPTSTIAPLQGIAERVPGADVQHVAGADPVDSPSLLPGLDPIPSDYLRSPADEPGVQVEYFEDWEMTKPISTEVVPYIALNGGFFNFEGLNAGSPHLPPIPPGYTSARYTGAVTPPVDGAYEIELVASGTTHVVLNGETILETGPTLLDTDTVVVELSAGERYELSVSYIHDAPAGTDAGSQLKLGWAMPAEVVTPQAQAAADLAAASDVAIVVAREYSSEGGDKPDLGLPNGQEALINAVKAANPNTIVVLTTGGPIATAEWEDGVPAILQAWYGGQNQGAAIARILFGDVSPSGKLPVTFPVSEAETPVSSPEQYPGDGLDSYYTEDVFVGYRGYDEFGLTPRFEFGHGLSYTTFEYSALTTRSRGNGRVTATFTITNTGERAGAEAAQVYVGELPTEVVPTAPRQLAGFVKVWLEPGESREVSVDLDRQSFSYWDAYTDRWVTPRGELDVYVGASSRDIRLTETIRVRSSDRENAPGLSTRATYAIVNENSGACVEAKDYGTANGTPLQQWSCPAPQPNAEWKLQVAGGRWYRIVNVNSGTVLDIAGSSQVVGARAQLWEWNGGRNQQFRMVRVGDGYYQIVARHSGKCLAVNSTSKDNGALIVQRTCDSRSPAQAFAFKTQSS